MEEKTALPRGIVLFRGETAGRRGWERRIFQRVGQTQIRLRFPLWEGAKEANALVEQAMERLYAYACQPREGEFYVLARYGLEETEGQLRLHLQGYVGTERGGEMKDWATLCFAWRGLCPCNKVILPKKQRKTSKRERSC